MPHRNNQNPEPLIQLQQQVDQWRATQPWPSKLPESIWQSAIDLAKQCGVYATAKALRLNYRTLRKRVPGSSPAPHPKPAPPTFVELIAPPAKVEDCVLEFESARGAKMRVQWKATAPPDWSSLLRAWREAEP
jgi:hypothetical protein